MKEASFFECRTAFEKSYAMVQFTLCAFANNSTV